MAEGKGNTRTAVVIVIELAIALAVVMLPIPIPAMILLLAAVMVALALRGLSFVDLGLDAERWQVMVPAGLLLGGLVAAILFAIAGPVPGGEMLLVEGNGRALLAALLVGAATAMVSEVVFRGYVIHRMQPALGKIGVPVGVLIGGVLSALVSHPDTLAEGFGILVFSTGYALLYLASKHKLLLPFVMHFAIDAHGVIIEYLGM